MRTLRRVVVTGIGLRSPLGDDLESNLAALYGGRSGVVAAPEWDWVKDLGTRVVGRANAPEPSALPRAVRRATGRVGRLALAALTDAIDDSGLSTDEAVGERSWLLVGSTLGALADIDVMFRTLHDSRSVIASGSSLGLRSMAHTAAISCSLHLGFRGRLVAPSAACATGTMSIGMGYEAVQSGRADIALAGAADESHVSTAATFDLLKAASTAWNDSPSCTPRPFDARRDGMVCAEGAGFLVLEDMERARARGARVYGEVIGFAANSAGTSATTPDTGAIERCLRAALEDAEVDADAVEYANAHATGTLAGDGAEAQGLARVFGSQILVSSSKGHTGHTMASAGVLEAAYCLGMLNAERLHPTLNLEEVSEDCAMVRHVREPLERPVSTIVSNNFALGGIQSSLVLRRI